MFDSPTRRRPSLGHCFGLALILLIAGALRLNRLGEDSVNYDTAAAFSRLEQMQSVQQVFRFYAASPLTQVKDFLVIRRFGRDDFMMRLPNAVGGILAVAVIYSLGRQLISHGVGLIAAFLLTISPMHLVHSRDTRYYSWVVLLSLTSLLAAARLTRKETLPNWAGYISAVVLGVYNHPTALFTLISTQLYLYLCLAGEVLSAAKGNRSLQRPQRILPTALALLVASGLVFFLLLPTRLPQGILGALGLERLAGARQGVITGFTGGTAPPSAGGQVAAGFELSALYILELLERFGGGGALLRWLYIGLSAVGLAAAVASPRRATLTLITVWMVVPFLVLRYVSIGHFMDDKYLIHLLPLYLLLAAYGLVMSVEWVVRWFGQALGHALRIVPAVTACACALFLGLTFADLRSALRPQYANWKGVTRYLAAQTRTSDIVLNSPNVMYDAGLRYYQRHHSTFVQLDRPPVQRTTESLRFDGRKRVWWVLSSYNESLTDWFVESGFRVRGFTGRAWSIYVVTRPEALTAEETQRDTVLLLEHLADTWTHFSWYQSPMLLHRIHLIVAAINLQNGRFDLARQHLELGTQHFEESMLIGGHGNNVQRHFDRIQRLYLAMELYEPLKALCLREAGMFPTHGWPHKYLGDVYRREGDIDNAISEYRRSVQLDPVEPDAHDRLASAYESVGRIDDAIKEYLVAIDQDSHHSSRYTPLAQLYLDQDRFQDAVAVYERAIARLPFEAVPYEALANLYIDRAQGSDAIAVYHQALEENPAARWPYEDLGRLYTQLRRPQDALWVYQDALQVFPNDAGFGTWLALTQERLGQRAEALETLSTIVDAHPHEWPYTVRGDLFRMQGKLEQAANDYQHALRLDPGNTYARNGLGQCDWDLGSHLDRISVRSEGGQLTQWPDRTWRPLSPRDAAVLVGPSSLPVDGTVATGQILLHPYDADSDTRIVVEVSDSPFVSATTWYGLADRATGRTNGVTYEVRVSSDGGATFTPLVLEEITRTVWSSNTVSLASLWGRDLVFELTSSANGDEAFDWLQVVLSLQRSADVWNLGIHLPDIDLKAGATPMEWRVDGAWYQNPVDMPLRLVGLSDAAVQGQVRGSQVQIHPAWPGISTRLAFTLDENTYGMLRTLYGLADEAVGRSNGVRYTIAILGDEGWVRVLDEIVQENIWHDKTVDLSRHLGKQITVQVEVDSLDDINYDWLQVSFDLLPAQQRD